MTLSLLEFSQKCFKDIDHDFLTLFDLIKGQDASFSTYPEEWCSRYLAQKYDEHDYVHLKNSILPIIWGESFSKDISPIQQKIFKEAQDFHIHKGITIPFRASNSPGFITVAFNNREKLSQNKTLRLITDLQLLCHIIFTYKHLLESEPESQEATLTLLEEVAAWQKSGKKNQMKKEAAVVEILSDIRAAQMFITHHETKELGLETLYRAYRDVERLM